jgi:dihydroflavonol-4-reductase
MHNGATFVTGATGFVGAHVARKLLARGEKVRALVRKGSSLKNLQGLEVEVIFGDLTDPDSLSRAISGCGHLYHVAADYRLWAPDPFALYRTNVQGTRNILEAAARAGVARIVYTSTVGALGIPGNGHPGTEETPVDLSDMIGHYKRSKFLAEQEAKQAVKRGLPVVIVNPSTPVGSMDLKPTPTGQMVVDFLNGRMPAYVETGLNLVDVEDVADGHLLAMEKGRVGERYILGCRNLTLKEILEILSRIAKRPAPRVRLPRGVALGLAAVSTSLSFFTKRSPRIPWEGVRMTGKKMFFDSSKAVRELGIPQRPVEEALERAVTWFRENGYAR